MECCLKVDCCFLHVHYNVIEFQMLIFSDKRFIVCCLLSYVLLMLDLHDCQVILALGDYMSVQCHACIGGTNLGEDIRKLDYGQHIVSGTPGRVFDMIRRRNLRTRAIKMFILDEADEMLNKGKNNVFSSNILGEASQT